MSLHAVGQAFAYSRAKGPTFVVLLVLADYARDEDEGECWPSLNTIAAKARVSRSTVWRAIQQLVDLGEIKQVATAHRERIAGRPETAPASNIYRVTVSGSGVPVWRHSPVFPVDTPGD